MKTQKDLSEKLGNRFDNSPEPMPPTKIQAFMEEFSWVKKHFVGEIVQVYAQGVEASLLNYFPERIDIGDLVPLFVYERILFLDEEGMMVTAEIETQRKRFFLCGSPVSKIKKIHGVVFSNSSVGAVVKQLGEKIDLVHFVVSYYSYTKAVIVYKLPKNISLKKWIKMEIEKEKVELQNEITAIA